MNQSFPSGISVVIPNYNGAQLLPVALPALYKALQHSRLPFEVFLCDDASTDVSIAIVEKDFPWVKILTTAENRGFSPTVNRGIQAAEMSYLLILNTDVLLPEEYFEPLLRYFDLADTFGVMTRIIGWESDSIQDGGKLPFFHWLKIKTSANYIPQHACTDAWLPSMYLSGANALVSTEKIKKLGGFNELFEPFYVEDAELSLRAWRMGWRCYYEHKMYCRHKESATIRSKNRKAYIKRVYNRNKMLMHSIHLPGFLSAIWHLQLLVETLASLLMLRLFYLQSFADYIERFSSVQRYRKDLRKRAAAEGKKLLPILPLLRQMALQLKTLQVIRIK